MTRWIALFRGINVGGNNILPMAQLRKDLESLKLKGVRTYIQSGNVLFDSTAGTAASLTKKVRDLVEKRHGFRPQVFLLKSADLAAAMKANPFPEAEAEPKTLHFAFLAEKATGADTDALDKAKAPSERYVITDRVFYLHAPDGIGRSKLAAKAEKLLGVVTTGRNFRTVAKLHAMATDDGA